MKILYDADCPLCLRLAHYAIKYGNDTLSCVPWQEYRKTNEALSLFGEKIHSQPADKIRVVADGNLLEGEVAWTILLHHHPSLKGLSWLATKLGLESPTARALHNTGKAIKKLCLGCRSR